MAPWMKSEQWIMSILTLARLSKLSSCQGAARAVFSLRNGELGVEYHGIHSRDLTSLGLVLQYPSEVSRADLEMGVRFNRESRSSDKFVVMTQVQDPARKSVHKSDSGLVRTTRVRHSPLIIEQVPRGKTGPRSRQKANPLFGVQVNGPYQSQVWVWLRQKSVILQHRYLINVYKYLMGGSKDKARLFSAVPSNRTMSNGHKLKKRKCHLVEKHLWQLSSPHTPAAQSSVSQNRLPKPLYSWVLNFSKGGDSTNLLGKLYQCSTSPRVKKPKNFLMFKQNFLQFNLCPLLFVLSLDTNENSGDLLYLFHPNSISIKQF